MIESEKNKQQKNDLLIEKLVFHGKKFPKKQRNHAVSIAIAEFKKITKREPSELFDEIYINVLKKLNNSDEEIKENYESPLKNYKSETLYFG
jgi:dimeric dUTPase (all-alpha-NTP-PPase superfamily)